MSSINLEEAKWLWWLMGILASFAAGLIGAGARMQKFRDQVITQKICRDEKKACMDDRKEQRKEDKEELCRELQNIHAAIADQARDIRTIEASVAAMPATIAKELRDMGIFK